MKATKSIGVTQARRGLGRLLYEVSERDESYLVERSGTAMAAVVPIYQFEQWRREREEFFALVDQIRRRNRRCSLRTIDQDVKSACRAVSRQRRRSP